SAWGLYDSVTLKTKGLPEFTQGEDNYEADKITFNFKTKRAKVLNVFTQEDEGFIHSEAVKRNADNSYYAKDNKYTTCNFKDHPDFYISASKMKVVPDKVIVSGPAHLVIEDVPTPLIVPFAIFPLHKSRASGILLPEFGQRGDLGIGLINGGYYFAISDYFDLQLRGDIYSRGSWRLSAITGYSKRYKYNGNFSLSYGSNRSYLIETNTVSKLRDFKVNWTFNQDSKANPKRRFNATVNAGTSGYNKTYAYNPNDFLSNTFKSSISYYRTINSKMNYTVNLSHDQNNQSHIVALSLPTFTFNVQRINPFQKKVSTGLPKWYEKIGFSYNMSAKNEVRQTDSLLFERQTLDRFTNGLKHSIPISTSFNLLKYFNVSPSFNFDQVMYLQSIRQRWDSTSEEIATDTLKGFATGYEYNTSIGMSTHIYGIKNFKHGKLKAIRHVMNPSIGYSYHPDFGETQYGSYKPVQYDSNGDTRLYSIFQNAPYGGPSNGKFGGINFGIGNQLELKVFSKKDTVNNVKKVKLLDNLSINSSYNLAVDSFQLAIFSLNARTTLFDKINLQFNSTFDPYAINDNGVRVNSYYLHTDGKLARLTSSAISAGASFHSKVKSPNKNYHPEADEQQEWEMINNTPMAYEDFNIPWNFSVNYILRANKQFINTQDTTTFTQTLNVNFDFNLTEKWKISGVTGYDFKQKDFSYTTIEIYRDLHCWQMSIRWVPFGTRQGYFLNLNVKSSVLQDLKLVKRSPGWGSY
ncbi:MAG: putative LPS assembly protein LptD, partial [Bacteroidota bacterium]